MTLKMLLPMSAGLLLLASCSNDSDTKTTVGTKQVSFAVSVPKSPRDATTTNSIDAFNVWSFVNNSPYMSEVTVTKGTSGTWSSDPIMYWPADNTTAVNFFSISPTVDVSTKTPESPDIKGFENPGNVDLLYGVNIGETMAANQQVHINFRHALSQITFTAKAKEDNTVTVTGLDIIGAANSGSFNFPRATTTYNTSSANSVGTWSDQSDVKAITILSKTPTVLSYTQTTPISDTDYEFVLPQSLTTVTGSNGSYAGTYIRLRCHIEKNGVKIWPSSTDANYDSATQDGFIIFPVSNDTVKSWEPGKHYNYTLTVGVPNNSGVIDFSVTVDQYSSFTNDVDSAN
jgi:hypothetical protein